MNPRSGKAYAGVVAVGAALRRGERLRPVDRETADGIERRSK